MSKKRCSKHRQQIVIWISAPLKHALFNLAYRRRMSLIGLVGEIFEQSVLNENEEIREEYLTGRILFRRHPRMCTPPGGVMAGNESRLTGRVEPRLHAAIRELAYRAHITMSAWARKRLETAVLSDAQVRTEYWDATHRPEGYLEPSEYQERIRELWEEGFTGDRGYYHPPLAPDRRRPA